MSLIILRLSPSIMRLIFKLVSPRGQFGLGTQTFFIIPEMLVKNKSAQKALKLKFCYDYTCKSITYLELGPPLLVKKETLFSKLTFLFQASKIVKVDY